MFNLTFIFIWLFFTWLLNSSCSINHCNLCTTLSLLTHHKAAIKLKFHVALTEMRNWKWLIYNQKARIIWHLCQNFHSTNQWGRQVQTPASPQAVLKLYDYTQTQAQRPIRLRGKLVPSQSVDEWVGVSLIQTEHRDACGSEGWTSWEMSACICSIWLDIFLQENGEVREREGERERRGKREQRGVET